LKLSANKKSNYYAVLLFTISASITLTLLTSTLFLYLRYESSTKEMIEASAIDTLTEISYTSTLMTELAKSMALQIYFNEQITPLIGYSNYSDGNDYDLSVALDLLKSFQLTNGHIHSIYVYNRKVNTFFTTNPGAIFSRESFMDKPVVQLMDHYAQPQFLYPMYRRIKDHTITSFDKEIGVFTFVFNDTKNSTTLDNAVIVNISEEWLRETIDAMNTLPGVRTFILDSVGQLVLNDHQSTMPEAFKIMTEDLKDNQGAFPMKVDGEKSLISYVKSEELGWTFVRWTPYEVYLNNINKTRLSYFYIAVTIFLVGLLSSYIVSRRLYTPVANTFRQLERIQTEGRDAWPRERNLLLLKELRNLSPEHHIQSSMKKYKLQINPAAAPTIIMVQIDRYQSFKTAYSFRDRELFLYSALNICSEILTSIAPNETVYEVGDPILGFVWLQYKPDKAKEQRLLELLQSAQLKVREYTQLSISFTLTSTDENTTINDLYHQLKHDNANRLRLHNNEIRMVHDTEPAERYIYSLDKEKKLTDALKLQKAEDAASVYSEIVNEINNQSIQVVQYVFARLASAVFLITERFDKNKEDDFLYRDLNSFLHRINNLDSLEEMNKEFSQLFKQMIDILSQQNQAVDRSERNDKIMEHIQTHFTDPNLSLESIANHFGLSANYLGRTFRKEHHVSVADFINDIRLKQAASLLQSTSRTVQDISELSGYYNYKYFCTLFKKTFGVTPSVYRSMNKD
jgi:AraC-like DNA-binding protein